MLSNDDLNDYEEDDFDLDEVDFETEFVHRTSKTGKGEDRHFFEITSIVGSIALVAAVLGYAVGIFGDGPLDKEKQLLAERMAKYPDKEDLEERRQREVQLGEYSFVRSSSTLTTMRPKSEIFDEEDGEGLRVFEFELAGLMDGSEFDVIKLERRLRNYEYRLRETIDEVARAATDKHLQDPNMIWLRKNMLARLNNLTGRPIFDDVIFSHYRMFEF